MKHKHEDRDWMRDIQDRQRNIVFPDTVRNEGRLWRNLGRDRFGTSAKIGLAVLAVFVVGNIVTFFVRVFQDGNGWQVTWRLTALMLLVWGPIFVFIGWRTRRGLKEIHRDAARKR